MLYKNPFPTVDCVIYTPGFGIVLVKRKNPPFGWALPGGFVDYGESVEKAAIREALEETSLHVKLTNLLGVYSEPDRDPRQHTISTIFMASANNPHEINGQDDALEAAYFPINALPEEIAFDHAKVIADAIKKFQLV